MRKEMIGALVGSAMALQGEVASAGPERVAFIEMQQEQVLQQYPRLAEQLNPVPKPGASFKEWDAYTESVLRVFKAATLDEHKDVLNPLGAAAIRERSEVVGREESAQDILRAYRDLVTAGVSRNEAKAVVEQAVAVGSSDPALLKLVQAGILQIEK